MYVGVVRKLRIHTSPISPTPSSLPSSSVIKTVPGTVIPTEPRCASHTCPVITVAVCASVPAYNSKMRSGPSQSIHSCFNHSGHGSARCHTTCRLEISKLNRSDSGNRVMRFIMVGTMYRTVPRCFSIASNVPIASNFASNTT